MSPEEIVKAFADSQLFGMGITKVIYRKWWNPMRWFFGPITIKRINPKKVFK